MSLEDFKADVKKGLSNPSKYLLSKYFYDEKGSIIFEEIMRMPEYYLTRCEDEILRLQATEIIQTTGAAPDRVVEFGSGDGTKTIHLLRALSQVNAKAIYVPVDISAQSIERLSGNIQKALPAQKIKPVLGDYFSFREAAEGSSLFLFLGSNLGNYTAEDTTTLLSHFYTVMKPGDHLLIGFDLQKNSELIVHAYDDKTGITKAFNLNLLTRMNRELGADFNPDQFDFVVTYNEENGELKSFLKSLSKQTVRFDSMDFEVSFEPNELIWTEISKKYTLPEIDGIAKQHQFHVKRHFTDAQNYFAVSLWQK